MKTGTETSVVVREPALVGEVLPGDDTAVVIRLSADEADALYWFLESEECPEHWETPLAPLHQPVRMYVRYGWKICGNDDCEGFNHQHETV